MTNEDDEELVEEKKDKLRKELRKKTEYEDRDDVTIYNVPDDVWSKFVSLAKLHYDNEGWQVLDDALESLIKSRTTRVDDLEERVDNLEVKVGKLASLLYSMKDEQDEESGPEIPKTFGE